MIDLKDKVDGLILLYEQKNRRRDIVGLGKRLSIDFRRHLKKRVKEWLKRLEQGAEKKTEAWWMPYQRAWEKSALSKQMSRADWILVHTVDSESEQLLMMNLLRPYYETAGDLGAKRSVNILQGHLGRKIVFKGTQAWIKDNPIVFGKKYSRLISKHSNEMIRKELGDAITQGKSLDWVVDRIKGKVLGQNYMYRAEMIGRTEMARAYNVSSVLQDSAMGLTQFEWFGCDEDCPICSEWLAGNPYTAEEIEYIAMNTHPNCMGSYVPIIPDDFVPDRDTVDFLPDFTTVKAGVY